MKITIKGNFRILSADEGCWITDYKDDTDIIFFNGYKTVKTTKARVKDFREITDEEYQAYEERKQIALMPTEEDNSEVVEP